MARLDGRGQGSVGAVPTGEILRDLCDTRKLLDRLSANVSDQKEVMRTSMEAMQAQTTETNQLLREILQALQENNGHVAASLGEAAELRAEMVRVRDSIREDVDARRDGTNRA